MNKLSYFVGIYGFLQLSMHDVGLLDAKGAPIKKKHNLNEIDGLAIYKWLSDELKDISVGKLRAMARETDERVSKLISDHKVVNNFLLAIMLLREYVDDTGTKMEQILLSSKINRLVDLVDSAVSDDDFDVNIKRTTARTANNIYRQFAGKCQLSDEVRDAHNKFRRKQ